MKRGLTPQAAAVAKQVILRTYCVSEKILSGRQFLPTPTPVGKGHYMSRPADTYTQLWISLLELCNLPMPMAIQVVICLQQWVRS